MKIYSTTLLVASTLYVTAENEEEARAKAKELTGTSIEFSNRRQDVSRDLSVTGEQYSRDMPTSLSPAMTILPEEEQEISMEEIEDFDEPSIGDDIEFCDSDVRLTVAEVPFSQPLSGKGLYSVLDDEGNQHLIRRDDSQEDTWIVSTDSA